MKKILFILFMLNTFLYPQEELINNKQFMLGCTNVGSNEQVTYNIQAQGAVWEYSSGIGVISSNQLVYSNSLITTGNANFGNPGSWPGFNFIWLDLGYQMPRWGLGLYKVTNTKQTDKYFYLDSRDYAYATNTGGYTNPDFFVFFNNQSSVYKYNLNEPQPIIDNGSVLRIWQIFNKTPNTSNLQNYWANALVVVPSVAQPYSPRIIWGPIPNFSATGYKVYWRYGGTGTFNLLATVGANTLEYTHQGLGIGNGIIAEYKVQAFNSQNNSDFTNVVSIGTGGWFVGLDKLNPFKIVAEFKYQLGQNYPNPFNPSTRIIYSIKEDGLVLMKVYDILGKEIATMVNENKPAGIYEVAFDASQLPSGIYIYSLRANGFLETKKMLLAK
jgi:hypothetical protein